MADHVLEQVMRLRDGRCREGQLVGVHPSDIHGNNAKKREAIQQLIADERLFCPPDNLLYLSPPGTDAPTAESTS